MRIFSPEHYDLDKQDFEEKSLAEKVSTLLRIEPFRLSMLKSALSAL